MAKAINWWTGTDTYGFSVEVAEREDGKFFARNDYRNGHYVSTTPWREHTPSYDTHYTNAYSGERLKHDKPVMAWGFNTMSHIASVEAGDKIRLRLPND